MTVYNYTLSGDEDYDVGPYNVTFMAGETQKKFNVMIINDSLLEENENLDFIISEHLPDKISHGNPYKTRLVILDDDGK